MEISIFDGPSNIVVLTQYRINIDYPDVILPLTPSMDTMLK